MFLAIKPLKVNAIDMQGAIPKAKSGTQYIVVMTDRLSKLTEAIPTIEAIEPTVATIFRRTSSTTSAYQQMSWVGKNNKTQFTY